MTPNFFNTYEDQNVSEIQFAAFELTDEELALVDGGFGHEDINDFNRDDHGHNRDHRRNWDHRHNRDHRHHNR